MQNAMMIFFVFVFFFFENFHLNVKFILVLKLNDSDKCLVLVE